MKKVAVIIICLLITTKLFAQDCSAFLYLQKGKTIEMTCFNSSGEVMWKIVNHVLAVSTVNGTSVSTVSAENFDKNGQSKGKRNVTFKCNGGAFTFDMGAIGSQPGGIKMTATNIEYPVGMKVGDHLKDVDMKMEMGQPGESAKEINTKITGMQVVAKERITTPAGAWDALKITFQTSIEMSGMSMPSLTTTLWFVPNVGIVQYHSFGMTMKITSIR